MSPPVAWIPMDTESLKSGFSEISNRSRRTGISLNAGGGGSNGGNGSVVSLSLPSRHHRNHHRNHHHRLVISHMAHSSLFPPLNKTLSSCKTVSRRCCVCNLLKIKMILLSDESFYLPGFLVYKLPFLGVFYSLKNRKA